MFSAFKLSKNADPDKCSYSEYGIEFDSCSLFSPPNLDWSKNAIIFGVENSSSVHIANKKIDIVVIGRGPTQGLDDTTIKSEAKYFINFPVSRIFFYLRLRV